MNCKQYKITGINKNTNRKKSLKITDISEENAIEEATNQGLIDIKEVESIPFEEPTERQIEYAISLNISIPKDACKEDVSALISKAVDRDGTPNEGLIEFATNRRLFFSKYIGKTAIYNRIFYELPDLDRVAFFIFSIYRYISDDRQSNLDTHQHHETLYEFANIAVNDERFMKSMNKYIGADLKFFGQFTTLDGYTHTGGSFNTIAFKEAREFLINNHLIAENSPFKIKRLYHSTTKTYRMTEEEIADARAKGFKIEVVREVTDEDNFDASYTYPSEETQSPELKKNFRKHVVLGTSVGFVVVFLYKLFFY